MENPAEIELIIVSNHISNVLYQQILVGFQKLFRPLYPDLCQIVAEGLALIFLKEAAQTKDLCAILLQSVL